MRVTLTLPIFAFIFFVSITDAIGQGCSDAGFCSVGGMQPDNSFNTYPFSRQPHIDTVSTTPKTYSNQLSLMTTFGEGDDHAHIYTPALQYTHMFTARLEAQAKITGNIANGHLGKSVGAGDIFLSGVYTITPGIKWKLLGTAGIKIPLNKSDLRYSAVGALPMTYQSSLGTVDLLLGLSLVHHHFRFSVGYQQPLTRQNANQYLQGNLTGTIYEPYALAYPNTRLFQRKADVLCRATYVAHLPKHFKLMLGGLAIYHTSNDTYKEPVANQEIEIDHSAGLTLNLTAGVSYAPTSRLNFTLNAGKPIIVREVRPDGLTRHWVLIPEVTFAF